MFIFCYGGKNATSVDACLLCKEMGVTGIGISIDTHGPVGDATISFGDFTADPISTIAGAVIVQAVTCRAIELMLAEGIEPEVLVNANVPGGDEHNKPIKETYSKIVHFIIIVCQSIQTQ